MISIQKFFKKKEGRKSLTTMHLSHRQGALSFLHTLNAVDRAGLMAFSARASEPVPTGYSHWLCTDIPLGIISKQRAQWLSLHLAQCAMVESHLVWDARALTPSLRSQHLQNALLCGRDEGKLSGWRNEKYSFWNSEELVPQIAQESLFDVERAGFRFLGLLSHAVHINGFLPDGRLWCARRALSKATDPGMLDNITAGGLPSGESLSQCAQRELWEEAGISDLDTQALQPAGCVRTSRLEPQGWHDEVLHVFNLNLTEGFHPENQDGEVAEFMCLQPKEVLARMDAGEFTVDATQTLVQGLRCAQQKNSR